MTERIYPQAKPDGFTPAVQRYSATIDESVQQVVALLAGVQAFDPGADEFARFLADITTLFSSDSGPTHYDHARYVDEHGYTNALVMAYWSRPDQYDSWWSSDAVTDWWGDERKMTGPAGYFVEPIPTSVDALETIAFREYIKGLSACPMSTIEPMGESGYWGAARDRIARSGSERFDAPVEQPLMDTAIAAATPTTIGRRVSVTAPANHCVIRSGVSWHECGEEQLTSYQHNVLPKLNAGMEYLRSHPIETGCWSLRQVDVTGADGAPTNETYVAGHFVSLAHLERWAHKHPTHLAIFGQAQKERIKYKEQLELRTYHEVYIVESPTAFNYINCHPYTGALGSLPERNGDWTVA